MRLLFLTLRWLAGMCIGLSAHAQAPRAVVPDTTVQAIAPRQPDSYTGRQLLVGSGGGFTGASTTYCLLDNGQLFSRQSRDTTYRFLGHQTRANTRRAFATVETKCRIKKTRFDKPGNIYKFVRWKRGKQQYGVTWGAVGARVPATYPRFYTSFMALIPATARPQ